MRLEIASSAATVCLNDLWAIYCYSLEGIHGNQDDSRIGVDAVLSITIADGVENYEQNFVRFTLPKWNERARWFIQMRQSGKIVSCLEEWRVA